MMYAHVKFHHNRSVQDWETELNTLTDNQTSVFSSEQKSGYIQQSIKSRSRSENNTNTAEMML